MDPDAVYKTHEPRYFASIWDDNLYAQRSFELGQGEALREAMFWLALGYTVQVARWDGTAFRIYENYLPGDL